MECKDIIKLISDYIDKEIEEIERKIFEEHIKICRRCEAMLDSIEKTILFSKSLYKKKKVPKKIEKTLYYQIRIRYKK